MPRPLAQQSSTQAKGAELARQRPILEAKVLEVEWRTRALNLNAVRGAEAHTQEQAPFKWKRASSQVAAQRSLAPTQAPL